MTSGVSNRKIAQVFRPGEGAILHAIEKHLV